ncbi:AI-2E family transporter [Butyricicoccus pullicaecorum]|uniref:AI-2E family transporter n=1 Tax=Butyricicoccus pullicaecorum TaxID=501571 RepID=UPI0039907C75
MKSPFQNQYFRVAVSAWLVIVMSILCFFTFYKLDTIKEILGQLSSILRPFTFGFVVAYLLLPIFNALVRKTNPWFSRVVRNPKKAKSFNKLFCSLISVTFFLLIVVALLSMVLPQLAESVMGLLEKLPEYLNRTEEWLTVHLFSNNPILEGNVQQLYASVSSSLMEWANTQLVPQLLEVMRGNFVGSFVSNTISFLKTVLVGFISAVYMLNSKDTFSAQGKKLIYSMFHTDTANVILENIRFVHKVFGGFITGKLLDSLIIGLITFFAMSILQMPYVLLISVIIGVTNIIPFFGPFIGAIPSTLLIILVSPLQGVYFVIFILILQQFDGNILGPKILGDSTGLASFWVMFAILLFGGMFGFAGMVVGVPLFAVIYSAVSGLVNRSLGKKKLSVQTADYITLDHIDAESGEMIPITKDTIAPTAVKLERFKRRKPSEHDDTKK